MPRRVRRRFLEKIMGGLHLGEEWLQGMAAKDHLAPARLEQASAVVEVAKPDRLQI